MHEQRKTKRQAKLEEKIKLQWLKTEKPKLKGDSHFPSLRMKLKERRSTLDTKAARLKTKSQRQEMT